jgi:cyclic pyranopterin phosphate synthase
MSLDDSRAAAVNPEADIVPAAGAGREDGAPPLVDPFGRPITYLRVSVTDRCDFRCVYCMSDDVTFLAKRDVLDLEELERICSAFVHLGVRKIRVTGGEPLVRKGVTGFLGRLSRHLRPGSLDELTMTTNGRLLADHAGAISAAGVRRINVSLDTLEADRFRAITGGGEIARVLNGLAAAREAGLRVKINVVLLKGINDDEIADMVGWCGARGFDMTLIELMPFGEAGGHDHNRRFLPLSEVRDRLSRRWTLTDVDDRTGGPARFVRIEETGHRLGFVSPLSAGFCEGCNRVRLTCTGKLYLCLGGDETADLRTPVRHSAGDRELLDAIRAAIARKPQAHTFAQTVGDGRDKPERGMNTTGG